MPNAEKRHIFAPVYGDENRLGSYVLFEVYPNIVDIALAAQRHAAAFDNDSVTVGYYSDSQVVTPELGGEFVFTSIPDELEDWLHDRAEGYDAPRLLPLRLDAMLEAIKAEHLEYDGIRWDCRPARLVADKDDIRLQAADKHAPDYYVWTSDLRSFFSALEVDFDVDGFAMEH